MMLQPPANRRGVLPERLQRLQHLDVVLLAAVLTLAATGLVAVYSATHGELRAAGLDPAFYLKRQAVWVAVGLAGMVAVLATDLGRIRRSALAWYLGSLLLLLLVASPLGVTVKGAQRWVQLGPVRLQPSELAEVAVVVLLAAWCARTHPLPPQRMLGALGFAAVPAILVLFQPDLGTALVFGVIAVVVVFAAGARLRELAGLAVAGVVAVAAVLGLGLLEDYQADRITGFVNPAGDTASGWNLRQSEVAVGAGGLTGAGLFQGSQTNLSFVPEQSTDFIFTVVGEELGFVGSALVVALFGVVAWRTWRAAAVARDRFGTLVCVGVLGLLVFKVFQNIGMTVSMMPITGIPLPFLSYGGSATIASFLAVGLVLDVGMRRFG
jgi:rod shape determining protein RodA